MPPTEIILTLLVWLAAGAAFLHYRRRAGAEFSQESATRQALNEANLQKPLSRIEVKSSNASMFSSNASKPAGWRDKAAGCKSA